MVYTESMMNPSISRFLLLVLLGGAWACASTGSDAEDHTGPVALMQDSESYYREGDCDDALDGFERLTLQLPSRDSIAVRARFLQAECNFRDQEYLEAARQFRRVVDEAPTSSLAPYALLRAGDAQAALWKRPELDPTYGDNAVNTYRELVSRFPNSPAAQRAVLKLNALSEEFAEKEYKNAEYYRRLGAFDSAILYYKNLVAAYPQTPHAGKALVKLVEVYDKLDYTEEMQEICGHLRQFYPDEQDAEDRCEKITTP